MFRATIRTSLRAPPATASHACTKTTLHLDLMIYTVADLRTIVPATTPAWIRIIEAYELAEEDYSTTKEWSDLVLPVLAYATLPNGEGAFLVYPNYELCPSGPTWMTRVADPNWNKGSSTRIELSVGTPPTQGVPCSITKDHRYVPTELGLFELDQSFWWVL